MDCRIDRPLPFHADSTDFVLCEHGTEHISGREAYAFFIELHRILKPGGVARIVVPDVTRIWRLAGGEYCQAVKNGGHGDGSKSSCVKAAIFEHGHQSIWSVELLETILAATGFTTVRADYGESTHLELVGVEGHGKVCGEANAKLESAIVEATK